MAETLTNKHSIGFGSLDGLCHCKNDRDQRSKRATFGLARDCCNIRLFLVIWTCSVPLFATADDCTDAFKSITGLAPGISVDIECSAERRRVYKGVICKYFWTGCCVCADVLDLDLCTCLENALLILFTEYDSTNFCVLYLYLCSQSRSHLITTIRC